VESFDYALSSSGSEGLVLSVIYHLDIPIMKNIGINVQPGAYNGTAHFKKNVNTCLNTNIYSYLETSSGESSNLYLMLFIFPTPVWIIQLWQLKTVVLLLYQHIRYFIAYLANKEMEIKNNIIWSDNGMKKYDYTRHQHVRYPINNLIVFEENQGLCYTHSNN